MAVERLRESARIPGISSIATMDEELILATMFAIRRYLDRHPLSADTLDGVHYSWLRSRERKEITQAALESLRDAGVVECVRYGSGDVLWRRARHGHNDHTSY